MRFTTARRAARKGFYRILYIEAAMVREALGPAATTLPFVKEVVFDDPGLSRAI